MDKPVLLRQIAKIREKAEAARVESVISAELVCRLEKENQDTTAAMKQLGNWKMTEQKLLRELEWVLDQLDQLER